MQIQNITDERQRDYFPFPRFLFCLHSRCVELILIEVNGPNDTRGAVTFEQFPAVSAGILGYGLISANERMSIKMLIYSR